MEESAEQLQLENEIKTQAQKFLTYLNSTLPESMELEYEGFYRRGFFVSKKRYAVIEDGEIIAKGLELVRRDWAPIVKQTQEAVLMAILKEGDSDKAISEVKKVLKKIRNGDVEKKDLIIHTQITKPLDQYKQVGPHVVAAKRIEEHGIKVSRGTIIQYIIVKGKGSISQRAIPYEYSEGYVYDKDYYINNQMIPAVERIMYSFGYTKKDLEDLAKGEVQQSLDAFFWLIKRLNNNQNQTLIHMINDNDRVVFFDVDDTLLDTSTFAQTARKAAIELMVDNGLPLDKDEAYGVLKTIIREKGSNYGKHFNVLTQVVLGHEDPMLVALGMITYHNVKMALLRPFAETIDTLIYLKSQGYRLAVISNGITIKQWEKLVRLNVYSFFDAVITSEEVGKKKPDKLIYDVALRKMKGDPEKSVMIGNKFKEDALGAVNAGMSAILVNSDVTEEDREYIKKEKLDITIIENIGDVNTVL